MTDENLPKNIAEVTLTEIVEHRREAKLATVQIDALTRATTHVLENTQHLVKLDTIADAVREMTSALKDVKESLIGPATGKDQVPRATAELMFNQQAKSNAFVCRVLGVVITGLLFVIGFLLTGDKAELIKPLHYFTSEK